MSYLADCRVPPVKPFSPSGGTALSFAWDTHRARDLRGERNCSPGITSNALLGVSTCIVAALRLISLDDPELGLTCKRPGGLASGRRADVGRGIAQRSRKPVGNGGEIFEAACRLGLEGIVSKRADSAYKAGRSKMWLKIKNRNHPALIRVFDPHGRRSS